MFYKTNSTIADHFQPFKLVVELISSTNLSICCVFINKTAQLCALQRHRLHIHSAAVHTTLAHACTLCGHIQSPRNAFEANLNHTQAQNAVISTCAVTPHQTMHTTPNHTQLSAVYPHAPNTNELRLLCQHGGHIRINQNDQNYYKIALQKYTLGRVEVPPAQPKIHPRSAVTHPHLSLAAGCVWWFTRGAQRWSAGCTVGLIKRRGWVLWREGGVETVPLGSPSKLTCKRDTLLATVPDNCHHELWCQGEGGVTMCMT